MALAGKTAHFDIGETKVNELSSWELPMDADMIDITSFDSNGWREFLQGLKSWTGSVEGNFAAAAGNQQKALFDAWTAGTVIVGNFVVSATVKFSGNLLITSISPTAPVDDKVGLSIEFQGTGALTPTIT